MPFILQMISGQILFRYGEIGDIGRMGKCQHDFDCIRPWILNGFQQDLVSKFGIKIRSSPTSPIQWRHCPRQNRRPVCTHEKLGVAHGTEWMITAHQSRSPGFQRSHYSWIIMFDGKIPRQSERRSTPPCIPREIAGCQGGVICGSIQRTVCGVVF